MTISAAIIGAGRTGGWHRDGLLGQPDVRLVGVADARREAAEAMGRETGAAAFDDYREMLARTRPDVAYVCTPAAEHLEQVRAAAELGINVFIEKPLATSVADAFVIADLVERHGILCTVGYQWRYNPATEAAREALAGRPIALLTGWWYWTIPPVPWLRDRRFGGGQIVDMATHLVDLMRDLAGDVTEVYAAYTRNAVPEAELPNWDANAVTLRFAGGAVGSLQTTYALFPGIPLSHGVDVAARELLVRVELGTTTIYRRDAEPEITRSPEGWNIDIAFMDAVRRNDPAAIRSPARDAAKSLAVTLAANYSAVTGKVVTMPEFEANPPTDAPIMPTGEPVIAGTDRT